MKMLPALLKPSAFTNAMMAAFLFAVLTTGCATGNKKGAPSEAPIVCGSSAWINEKEFELPDLKSTSDKEYEAWINQVLVKYPQLKASYRSLRECVKARFPDSPA